MSPLHMFSAVLPSPRCNCAAARRRGARINAFGRARIPVAVAVTAGVEVAVGIAITGGGAIAAAAVVHAVPVAVIVAVIGFLAPFRRDPALFLCTLLSLLHFRLRQRTRTRVQHCLHLGSLCRTLPLQSSTSLAPLRLSKFPFNGLLNGCHLSCRLRL